MLTVLEVTLPVFALVLCGWVAARRGLLQDSGVEGINIFVFWFALPAMLFRAVAAHPVSKIADPGYFAAYLLAGAILFAGMLWLARRRPAGDRTALAFSATHGNVGFLGLPLLAQLGDESRLPAMVMTIVADICVVIVGSIVLFEFARSGEDGGTPRAARLRAALGGLLRTPLILGIVAGLVFSATGAQLPAPADALVRLLAQAAGPCALFAIGASLGGRAVVLDRSVGGLLLAKLVVHPVLVGAAMWALGVDPALAAIGVLAAALPTASNTYILSQRYGIDTRAIGSAIVIGTFAAAGTVSFVIWLLQLRTA
ncbi:MAG: AEC family transporter [Burkholderiales bacterium]|nr:AEC family transporter [Burkholderiales bacterium]